MLNWDNEDDWPGRRERNRDGLKTVPPADAPAPADAPPDFGNFDFPSYDGASSPIYNFGEVPLFHAPQFSAPTFADAQAEPGYQFRLGTGTNALQNSAAARGVLRTGGTLKDILEYGQKFGSSEYSNVFDRAMRSYSTRYQGAKDEYAPLFAQYNNRFGAEQTRALAEFQRQMDIYNANLENARFKESILSGVLNTPQPTVGG